MRKANPGAPFWILRDECERGIIMLALREAGNNVTLAASRLGIDRTSLNKRMRYLGLPRDRRQGRKGRAALPGRPTPAPRGGADHWLFSHGDKR